jgi:NAD+ kinase
VTTASITRAGIVAKPGLAASGDLDRLVAWLEARNIAAVFETETASLAGSRPTTRTWSRDELPNHVDLVIVLGGDGTLLSMATRIARTGCDVPMLGVNFGSLGFLTETRIDELYATLESIIAGTATYDTRAILAAEAYRDRERFDSRLVLNDVVFTKAALSRIIELSVSVSTGLVTKVKADGLIVASATGSTAYNLAAGGPIVHPRVDALILTPIAPHTLTHRPVVIPGSETVEVRPLPDAGAEDIYVTYDGQSGYPLQKGDSIRIRKHDRVLRLVRAPARTYFEVLREKLKWGER